MPQQRRETGSRRGCSAGRQPRRRRGPGGEVLDPSRDDCILCKQSLSLGITFKPMLVSCNSQQVRGEPGARRFPGESG